MYEDSGFSSVNEGKVLPEDISTTIQKQYREYIEVNKYNLPADTTEYKHINIIDPVIPTNNLGKGISYSNMLRIKAAFKYAASMIFN